MRFFGGRGDNAHDKNNSTNGDTAAQQPLLNRPNRLNRQISNISGVSYGSVVSRGSNPGVGTVPGTGGPADPNTSASASANGHANANGARRRSRSRSKRRRTKIRTSIYADPPASYKKAILSYTLIVTLSSTIFLILFGVLKLVAWPHTLHPTPAREFLLAAGAWTVAFALRIPLYYISTLFGNYVNNFTLLVSTFFQVFTQEALRLAILVLLQLHLRRPPEEVLKHFPGPLREDGDLDWAPMPDVWDPAFTQVWWMAMGWATVDVAVGIAQGYEQLSLYRDILPHYHHRKRHHSHSHHQHQHSQHSEQHTRNQASSSSPPRNKRKVTRPGYYTDGAVSEDETRQFIVSRRETASSLPKMTATPLPIQGSALVEPSTDVEQGPEFERPERIVMVAASPRDLEAELSNLITRKQRAELEEVYGTPLPRIPIFLIALQRLDSILLTLGLTLLISSAYLQAFYLPAVPTPSIPSVLSSTYSTSTFSPSIFSSFSSALSTALSSLSPSLHSTYRSFTSVTPSSPSAPSTPISISSSAENPKYEHDWLVDTHKLKDTTLPAFVLVVLVHFFLTSLWMEALPRIGVHTVSYVGLLVSLAAFFAGLGYWGALV